MGKKDKKKKKNKISGQEKTALKTEKKLNAKQKRELAALGEVRFVSFPFLYHKTMVNILGKNHFRRRL